jgi:hypothetical protein
MMRWLHRRASDYLGVTAYLVERDHAVAQRTLAYGQLLVAISGRDAALREARESERMADGCRSILSALIEPGVTEQCTKIRLRDRGEGEAFAARITMETGVEVEPYKCRRCPRQPVSVEAFWHVTHVDPAKRGQHGKADPPQPPRLLRHVTPADVAAIRARVNGGAS